MGKNKIFIVPNSKWKWLEYERSHCQNCGKKLDLKNEEYHQKYGMCNANCYMEFVGMSWRDFL